MFGITLSSFAILFLASSLQGFMKEEMKACSKLFMTLSDIDIDIKHNNHPTSAADYLYDSTEMRGEKSLLKLSGNTQSRVLFRNFLGTVRLKL